MFLDWLERLIGCKHKRLSFPQTPRRGTRKVKAALATGCYVVCLDCGEEFGYDWEEMIVEVKNMSPGNGQKEGKQCH